MKLGYTLALIVAIASFGAASENKIKLRQDEVCAENDLQCFEENYGTGNDCGVECESYLDGEYHEEETGFFGDDGENDILYFALIGAGLFLLGIGAGIGIYFLAYPPYRRHGRRHHD